MFAYGKLAREAAIGTLVILSGFGLSARAEEPVQRLGPVGPHEPIMTKLGNKGLIAFYEPDGTHCGLYAVVYSLNDDSGTSGAQVRIRLDAHQVLNIDSPDNKSLSLQCGEFAQTLRIVDPDTVVAAGPPR